MTSTHRKHLLLLDGLPVLPPLAGLLHLVTPSVRLHDRRSGHRIYSSVAYLVSEHLGPGLLRLLLVDVLHEHPLVLEGVTLGLQVELVVQVAVDLLRLPGKDKII